MDQVTSTNTQTLGSPKCLHNLFRMSLRKTKTMNSKLRLTELAKKNVLCILVEMMAGDCSGAP